MTDKPDSRADDPRPLAEIDIDPTSRGVIRCQLKMWKGRRSLAIRRWYWADGELKPGVGGLSIREEAMPALFAAMAVMKAAARRAAWIPADGAPGRPCEGCGAPVTSTRADARYCSPRCRARASRTKAHATRTETHAEQVDPNDAFDR